MDFEARLVIDPAHTLEELNARLWRWIESEYHQRPHSALNGQTPAERFTQRALNLRIADAQTDWEALFLSRAERRVRLDATFSLAGPTLGSARASARPASSKCASIPSIGAGSRSGARTNIVGPARRCDKQLNSKTYTDRDYDRPDKSVLIWTRLSKASGAPARVPFGAAVNKPYASRHLQPDPPSARTVGLGAGLRPAPRPQRRGQDPPGPALPGIPARQTLQAAWCSPIPRSPAPTCCACCAWNWARPPGCAAATT